MDRYVDEGAGIFLRPMTHDDTELIIRWRNSEAVRRNFIYQKPFTREGHENWIRTMIDTKKAVQLMICEIASGRAVGSVYIRDIDREHNKAEYGIFTVHRAGSNSQRSACLLFLSNRTKGKIGRAHV